MESRRNAANAQGYLLELTNRFTEALVYAAQLHAAQRRKGGDVPYVAHLLGVAAIALEHGAGEDAAIAALLHDAVEDQGGAATREEILCRFGGDVARIVEGCTDADSIPKPPWRDRKERYLANLAAASADVRLVSAADKLYNARTLLEDYRRLGESLWQRFTGGRDGTLWYYRALAAAYLRAEVTPLAEELERTVTELERLASLPNRVSVEDRR